MTPGELEALTFEYLPTDFVQRALRAVFLAHERAWLDTKAIYADTEAENVRPFLRRANLEGYLRDASDQVPGVEATVVREPEYNWWWHTEVRAGPVVLTESAVRTPCGLVNRAEFRKTLARDGQMSFFESDVRLDGDSLYLLMLHSTSSWTSRDHIAAYGHLPGSVYLAYPAHDLTSYVHTINLFDMFAALVDDLLPNDWNSEVRLSYLQRAKRLAV